MLVRRGDKKNRNITKVDNAQALLYTLCRTSGGGTQVWILSRAQQMLFPMCPSLIQETQKRRMSKEGAKGPCKPGILRAGIITTEDLELLGDVQTIVGSEMPDNTRLGDRHIR